MPPGLRRLREAPLGDATACDLAQALGKPLRPLAKEEVGKSRRLGQALKLFLATRWKAILLANEEALVHIFILATGRLCRPQTLGSERSDW